MVKLLKTYISSSHSRRHLQSKIQKNQIFIKKLENVIKLTTDYLKSTIS